MNQDIINVIPSTYVEKNNKEENEYIEYNKKMEIIYNALKFDYLVKVAVKELNELNKKN